MLKNSKKRVIMISRKKILLELSKICTIYQLGQIIIKSLIQFCKKINQSVQCNHSRRRGVFREKIMAKIHDKRIIFIFC